jgi:hypothetical protein
VRIFPAGNTGDGRRKPPARLNRYLILVRPVGHCNGGSVTGTWHRSKSPSHRGQARETPVGLSRSGGSPAGARGYWVAALSYRLAEGSWSNGPTSARSRPPLPASTALRPGPSRHGMRTRPIWHWRECAIRP